MARFTKISLVVAGLALAQVPAAVAWAPGKAPLKTRWTDQVRPNAAHPEYPRPQMTRSQWLNLNGLWQFQFGKKDDVPPLGLTLEDEILVPFPVESSLSGVMQRGSHLWYRRLFKLPEEWDGKRTLLHFGAVDWMAKVWVNETLMGTHRGGYDSFSFDITDALKEEGPQDLLVEVFDPSDAGSQPRGKQVNEPKRIWYTPSSGIWQTVWLEPVPDTRIERLRIRPDVDAELLEVTVIAAGQGLSSGGCVSEVTALDAGKELARGTAPLGDPVTVKLPNPRLWSPDDPFLYDLQVSLKRNDAIVDSVNSYAGMRKIEVAPDEQGIQRLMLNGDFVFQMGFLDQGFWPDGLYTAPTDDAYRYDIEATKGLGFNMARKHVKVEPERWYYWCDRLGLLVWQDMPNGDNATPEAKKQFERELEALVKGRGNHPCIVMWVVFNEGWGQFDTERLTQWVSSMDPDRLVNNASGWTDMKVGDVVDWHRYPGPASPKPEESRAAVLGEFGGLGLGVDGHTWTSKSWGYQGVDDQEALTERYLRLMRRVYMLMDNPGLSAAVYTQTTDVETECNGLLTYDRAVVKVQGDKVAAANRGELPSLKIEFILPASEGEPAFWRYTSEPPEKGWEKPKFKDNDWRSGPAGFGSKGTPGAHVRTPWETSDIWLRRSFDLETLEWTHPHLWVHHDEDCEIYINGTLAMKASGYTQDYEEYSISKEAVKSLKKKGNVLAVHCRQTKGGQYIDVGLVDLKDSNE